MKAYGADLAYIHDAGFTDFAGRTASQVLALLRQTVPSGALVVELGCGSGVLARRVTDAGYDLLAVDKSAAMIALARKKAPHARFRTSSFLTVRLPRCDAVIALGEVFNYEFGLDNDARLYRFFTRVRDALKPGGIFMFDMAGPGRVPGSGTKRIHKSGRNWAILVEHEEKRRTLTRRIISFRRIGRLYRRSQETHKLRLYNASEIARALRRAGFRVRTRRGWGQLKLGTGHVAFVARKP